MSESVQRDFPIRQVTGGCRRGEGAGSNEPELRRQRRKPVELRRGPATVSRPRPVSQELPPSLPATSGRGHPGRGTWSHVTYPFGAVVGMDDMRLALLRTAVSPAVGGVLVGGEKGTAKSTTVRALAAVLPPVEVVAGCRVALRSSSPGPAL